MIVHVGAHGAGNAGDIVINWVMDKILTEWDRDIVRITDWHETTDKTIDLYNRADLIIVGGGGLLIPDTHKNTVSGWRWNISKEQLERINKPIALFGIGYNYFRGHKKPDEKVLSHFREVVKRSVFVGMREHWSPLHEQMYLKYQPCPTVLLSRYWKPELSPEYKVIVPAMDRLNMRGNGLERLKKFGYDQVAEHTAGDLKYGRGEHLYNKSAEEIIQFYERASEVASMRLHGLLIPFALGIDRIMPIDTHDKITRFASSINIRCEELNTRQLSKEREKMIEITDRNLQFIYSRI